MHGHVYAGTTNPATLKQADETIHHLMEDIGDFVVFANNLSLVCTIYIFISKQDKGKKQILHISHTEASLLFLHENSYRVHNTFISTNPYDRNYCTNKTKIGYIFSLQMKLNSYFQSAL